MAKAVRFDLDVIEEFYRIEEDGKIWSYFTGRYKKTFYNGCNYLFVSLSRGLYGAIGVHRLVARKYIGICPEGMEVNHKDGNRINNHWTNLEYVTHAENMRKSYEETGRVGTWRGRKREPFTEKTKKKMAEHKKKRVVADTGEVWGSIGDCATSLGTYRKAIYNSIKHKKRMKNGLRLQFVTP
jgi:hypothetical protein